MAEGAVWSAAIGEVEPAVERGVTLAGIVVDGAVGPAAEHGADEALGFAVGAWAYGRVRMCLIRNFLQATACASET